MKKYKNILLALALDEASDERIVTKTKEIAQEFGSSITMIHAIEHLSSYGAAYGVTAGLDVEEVLKKEAQETMSKLAEELGVDESHQLIEIGPAKYVILAQAKKSDVDLIVIGSHGRHGVQLLLGSTANAVLHAAECDVLAVRVEDES